MNRSVLGLESDLKEKEIDFMKLLKSILNIENNLALAYLEKLINS